MRFERKILSAGIFGAVLLAAPLASYAQAPAAQGAPAAQAAPAGPGRGAGQPAGGVCNAPCDPYPGMKKLLVVADVSTGYDHDSINHTMGVVEQIGRQSGVWVSWLRTDSQLITKGVPTGVTSPRYATRGPAAVNKRNLNYFD